MLNWFHTLTDVTTAAAPAGMTGLPMLSKGLLTTAFGLLGVFLVLALLFITIKVMQRIKTKETGEEN